MDHEREHRIGRWRVVALRDGRFALDGGAMFGVVPRVLWERLTPVHEDHTIPLATNPFLFDDGEHRVVVEPGIGRRWNDKERAMFHIDHSEGCDLVESLRAAGVEPEQVTHCLMSHCHWDHIGAACDLGGQPVFPKARYLAPESEIRACLEPSPLRRASYRAEDLRPILDAGLLEGFHGAVEVLPGLRMVEVGGHSDGTSLILLEDCGATACFWADVVPTRHHVHLPFIMAYDQNAARSYEVRSEWIPRAVEEAWWCLLYHDPEYPIVRFDRVGRRYQAV